jgi:hypothetical protein
MEKPKMYFVCEFQNADWYSCTGVLSNGFAFGGHVCSHPGYAPGDLYFTRKNRIDALKEIFGFEWDRSETETIVVRSKADIPEWWMIHAELQEGLKEQYERYDSILKGESQNTEIEITAS